MNESDSTDAPDLLSLPMTATQLQSKATIDFAEAITSFFYYQNHIICRCKKRVLIYSTLTKKTDAV